MLIPHSEELIFFMKLDPQCWMEHYIENPLKKDQQETTT